MARAFRCDHCLEFYSIPQEPTVVQIGVGTLANKHDLCPGCTRLLRDWVKIPPRALLPDMNRICGVLSRDPSTDLDCVCAQYLNHSGPHNPRPLLDLMGDFVPPPQHG